ncbi:hypothetical protein EV421DRAFT_1847616 [Armillaria borealis]|uniref:Uncharacterized protein n=1 Tax=Armillaria borealis TaxID=47425 RepID=A0AA39IYF3_9AGAR|nr:hypothetical protein EV421DRAFT_1847616 [Armillaria borealis]
MHLTTCRPLGFIAGLSMTPITLSHARRIHMNPFWTGDGRNGNDASLARTSREVRDPRAHYVDRLNNMGIFFPRHITSPAKQLFLAMQKSVITYEI